MKRLTVVAAGFGGGLLEREKATNVAGLRFETRPSVFPAVTCVAQASLRTGLTHREHGMISNGWWSDTLAKPLFWEQSSALVRGDRVWAERRARGETVGLFFFQQSLGEAADAILSPAPIHRHGGGMTMSCYSKPTGVARELEEKFGKFPLWRYWGPLASPSVGDSCLDWFFGFVERADVDEAYLYLPTLDYAAQKHGPGSPQDRAAFRAFARQLERLADFAAKRGVALEVTGDYGITSVTLPPATPNVTLREAGFFKTRQVGGRAYPDFYQSTAFAMCDHEFCVIEGGEREKAAELLLASGDYEAAGDGLLLARKGSWCAYRWWTNPREAPDYAKHVDIHNKPGYDPTELFFFGRGTVKGTHGRQCEVAYGK